jgi:wobble nucleotide-excising tRNase
MLKRISKITAVVPFRDCSAGSVELRQVSLLFGHNSQGKSTLCEILRSLEAEDSTQVRIRESIPRTIAQHIKITMAEDGKAEVPLEFKDAAWQSRPAPFQIMTFDSAFVSRNLFTGDKVDRGNKEALSRFILGEQGVQQANDIADMRKQQAANKSALRKLIDQLKDIHDVDAFVALDVSETEDQLLSRLQKLRAMHDASSNLSGQIGRLRQLSALYGVTIIANDTEQIEKLNDVLASSLETAHETAKKRVEQHVKQHLGSRESGFAWIQQGVELNQSSHCPFCGQALEGAPAELLEAYQKVFDASFRAQSETAIAVLDSLDITFTKQIAATQYPELQALRQLVDEYEGLSSHEEFRSARADFIKHEALVTQNLARYVLIAGETRTIAMSAAKQKRAKLEDPHALIDLQTYRDIYTETIQSIKKLNETCTNLNRVIRDFIESANNNSFLDEQKKLELELRQQSIRYQRKVLNSTCTAYSKAKEVDATYEKNIKDAEIALVTEQSSYLEEFFEKINVYFQKFGNQYFSIATEKQMNTLGYQPVLSLKVRYQSTDIDPQKLNAVFSESDKRALALAIFWAKLSVLKEHHRAKMIVVLDDPVTSFDDNRISASIKVMREEGTRLRQLIVLTHYRDFVRRWLKSDSSNVKFGFYSLNRDSTSSRLKVEDAEAFTQSDQQRLFTRIKAAASSQLNAQIASDLRVFLETEIRDRYRYQLDSVSRPNASLKEIIDHLLTTKAITSDVANQAHLFREDLNVPHHDTEERNPNDVATTARDLLTFVYTKL